MMKLLGALFVLAMVLCVVPLGCGVGAKARVEVAAEAAGDKIDELLGSMAVKRKEIELRLQALDRAVVGLKKAKLKAQGKADELNRNAEPSEARLREIDATLVKYRDLLSKNEPASLGGKTYSPEELKANADRLIQGRKSVAASVDAFKKSKGELQKSVDTLASKQRSLESQIDEMKNNLGQIDSKMVAVKAIKEAKVSAGSADLPISESVEGVADDINSLLADVDLELSSEGESFDEESADSEINSIDAIVAESATATDTVSDIDKILGESK